MKKTLQDRLYAIQSKVPMAVTLMTAAALAHADDTIDVSTLTPKMVAGAAAVATLGLAYLGVTVVKKLWGKLGG